MPKGMKEFYHNMKKFSIIDELISDVGGVPVTTVIKMNDCAIHIGVSGIGLEETSTNRTT